MSQTLEPPAAGAEQCFSGTLARVIFHNPDTQYTVALLEPDQGEELTIVGNLYNPIEGQALQVTGRWKNHPRYGRQFVLATYQLILPTSAEGIERFLAGRFVRGIGPSLARLIVARFGDQALDVLDQHPEKLRAIRGIGQKKLATIIESWEANRQVRQLMLFLGGHGIGGNLAARIHQRYGADAIARIKRNPYQLALDIERIGFQTADQIAQKLGLPADSPQRAAAGLLFCLHQQAGAAGHCCLPHDLLVDETLALLRIEDRERVELAAAELIAGGDLLLDDRFEDRPVYLPAFHRAEQQLARGLLDLAEGAEPPAVPAGVDPRYLHSGLIQLTPRQEQALLVALGSRISIVTGGPGVGKTTLVRRLVALALEQGRAIALAAPTGRAAKRLAEATGAPASTIHRLLRFNPREGQFDQDESHPLEVDLLILDEASMIDLFLMRAVVRALPDSASLVLVGDADQLPSVGPGNVLADLIDCGRFPVTRLDEVFRQAAASRIVHTAHLINEGHMPDVPDAEPDGPLSDFYYVRVSDPARCAEMVLHLAAERIPSRFGFEPLREIQLITPMHRGEVGTIALNEALQQRLNPDGRQIELAGRRFRIGDKVMQVKNNYDKDVFNGDIGFVAGHDAEEERLEVRYDDRTLAYDADDVDQLKLAYCVTVHKSQGSEYPAVVLPLLTQHYMLLQRNLLYTAITRGKRLVVIVGSDKALRLAIANDKIRRRYSHLADRLRALAC